MADVNLNVNAPAKQAPAMAPPTHTDDQILPYSRWVPVGKSNYYLDVEKSQSNPIYKIVMDILKHTNFFRSFNAFSTIPLINIQQFWDTIRYDKDTARYICQLDEQWFDLTKDTLRDALQITPVNNNNPFSSPLTPDALISFVNNLDCPKVVRTLSAVFSAKGTKWEVFGMPILNELITADIRGKQYYKEYLEKVAKHQRYLTDEERSDPDSPAPKPAKATKKSKPSAPKAAPVTKPALVMETSNEPSPAKRSKSGLVTKRRKPTSSLRLVDEFFDKGIPEREPRFDDEEADMQRAVEESLKSVHDVHQGPLLPVVFKEPDCGKFQPLPEVQGKGKDKEMPHVVKIRAQDEGQAGPNPDVLIEGQVGSNPGDDAEPQPQSSHVVHAGPNLEHMDLEATNVSTQKNLKQMDEGFTASAYPNVQENLKLTVEEQVILEEHASSTGTLSSLQHLAKDFSFGDQFFNDKPSEAENEKTTRETKAESMVSITIHQDTSAIPPMTSTVIDLISRPDSPNDHRPLPATAIATTTTTTIKTLPLPPQPQQGTIDSILIKQIGKLKQIMDNLIQDNKHLEERLDNHGSRLYKLKNLNILQQVSKAVDVIVTDAVDWAIQASLQNRFRDFPEADMKEILHQRIWKTNSYKAHEDHIMLYEALEKSMNREHTDELLTDLAEARRKKKKRHDSSKTP
nr:hypothetical protein [Tanacetum cinerariifolium]